MVQETCTYKHFSRVKKTLIWQALLWFCIVSLHTVLIVDCMFVCGIKCISYRLRNRNFFEYFEYFVQRFFPWKRSETNFHVMAYVATILGYYVQCCFGDVYINAGRVYLFLFLVVKLSLCIFFDQYFLSWDSKISKLLGNVGALGTISSESNKV